MSYRRAVISQGLCTRYFITGDLRDVTGGPAKTARYPACRWVARKSSRAGERMGGSAEEGKGAHEATDMLYKSSHPPPPPIHTCPTIVSDAAKLMGLFHMPVNAPQQTTEPSPSPRHRCPKQQTKAHDARLSQPAQSTHTHTPFLPKKQQHHLSNLKQKERTSSSMPPVARTHAKGCSAMQFTARRSPACMS